MKEPLNIGRSVSFHRGLGRQFLRIDRSEIVPNEGLRSTQKSDSHLHELSHNDHFPPGVISMERRRSFAKTSLRNVTNCKCTFIATPLLYICTDSVILHNRKALLNIFGHAIGSVIENVRWKQASEKKTIQTR